jgi:hypothetical protein
VLFFYVATIPLAFGHFGFGGMFAIGREGLSDINGFPKGAVGLSTNKTFIAFGQLDQFSFAWSFLYHVSSRVQHYFASPNQNHRKNRIIWRELRNGSFALIRHPGTAQDGFADPWVGRMLPSQTKRLAMSCERPKRSTKAAAVMLVGYLQAGQDAPNTFAALGVGVRSRVDPAHEGLWFLLANNRVTKKIGSESHSSDQRVKYWIGPWKWLGSTGRNATSPTRLNISSGNPGANVVSIKT